LEAHKNNTLVTHLIAVDQVGRTDCFRADFKGYDNPMYAALEIDYHESDQDPTGEACERAKKVRMNFEES
jgi:splicing factor 3B subunit 3